MPSVRIILRGFTAALALAMIIVSPTHAQTVQTLFEGKLEITIPDDYRPFDPRVLDQNGNASDASAEQLEVWFVSTGAKSVPDDALAAFDPDTDNNPFVTIRLVKLKSVKDLTDAELLDSGNGFWTAVPEGATARDVHDLLCGSFLARWGKFSFDLYDADTSIGRCVNVAGAFVAVFTKKIGNALIVMEAMDPGAHRIVESQRAIEKFAEMTIAEKWQHLRPAANADTAERILLSARLVP